MNLAILMLTFLALSCNDTDQVLYDNAICWEIRKDNSRPTYILGSIHSLDSTKISFPITEVKALIDQCGSFCAEAQLDSNGIASLSQVWLLKDTTLNITNTLNKDSYDQLVQLIASAKTELKLFKPILSFVHPSIVTLMVIGEGQLGKSKLYDQTNFMMDSYLRDYAHSKGYTIKWLESVEDYDRMFNIPFDESIKALEASIAYYHAHPPNIESDMIERYINQDLALLDAAIYTDSTMTRRNQKMADGIEKIMQEAPVFVVIGAAHLPYEHGVLNLLKRKGYSIKPHAMDVSKK